MCNILLIKVFYYAFKLKAFKMEKDKLNNFSASVPDPDTYSYFKLDYLKRKIADKNTNLTKISSKS